MIEKHFGEVLAVAVLLVLIVFGFVLFVPVFFVKFFAGFFLVILFAAFSVSFLFVVVFKVLLVPDVLAERGVANGAGVDDDALADDGPRLVCLRLSEAVCRA